MSSVNIINAAKNRNDQQVSEELIVINYDCLGNLIIRCLLPDLVPDTDETEKIMDFKINTRDHRVINKLHRNQDKVLCKSSSIEMENHADTFFVKIVAQFHSCWSSTLYLLPE